MSGGIWLSRCWIIWLCLQWKTDRIGNYKQSAGEVSVHVFLNKWVFQNEQLQMTDTEMISQSTCLVPANVCMRISVPVQIHPDLCARSITEEGHIVCKTTNGPLFFLTWFMPWIASIIIRLYRHMHVTQIKLHTYICTILNISTINSPSSGRFFYFRVAVIYIYIYKLNIFKLYIRD